MKFEKVERHGTSYIWPSDGDDEMVSVPVELLRKVLDEFELETFGDDYASEQMQVEAERMRGDIAELRRIAGIQTP
jgi:hypothetical protein